MLDEGGRLPDLAPTPTGIQATAGQTVHCGQGLIKLHGLVEIGPGINPISLQTHVIGSDITQFKHPGLDPQTLGLLDGDAVGNDEISIHEDMPDSPIEQELAQKRPPCLHVPGERDLHLPRETELLQGKGHLGDRDPATAQIATEPGKEQADGSHQQQHRAVDPHLHQGWSPICRQRSLTLLSRAQLCHVPAAFNAAAVGPSGGRSAGAE